MATFRPGSRLHPDVERAIADWTQIDGMTPAQIDKKLSVSEELKSYAPDLRTIQRAARHYRIEDRSRPWHLGLGDADDARIVLDVLAEVHRRSRGGVLHLTEREAAWVVRVARARARVDWSEPGLDAWAVFQIARRYLALELRGEPTEALDLNLALGGPDRESTEQVARRLWAGCRAAKAKRNRGRKTDGEAR